MEKLFEIAAQKAKDIDLLIEDLRKAAESDSGEHYFDIVKDLMRAGTDYRTLSLEIFDEMKELAKKIENQEQTSMEEGFNWIAQFVGALSCMSQGWKQIGQQRGQQEDNGFDHGSD